MHHFPDEHSFSVKLIVKVNLQLIIYTFYNIQNLNICHKIPNNSGGARGVMVIVVGNGHSDTSSIPGRD